MRSAVLGSDREMALAMANRWLAEAEAALVLVLDRSKTKWRQRFEVRSERLLAGYDLVVSALRWTGAWTSALGRLLRQGREELLQGRRMSLMPIEEEFRGHWVSRTGFEWPGEETFFSYERPSLSPKVEWAILGAAGVLVMGASLSGAAEETLGLALPTVAALIALWGLLALRLGVDVKVERGRLLYRLRGVPLSFREVRIDAAGELRCVELAGDRYSVQYRGRTLFLTTTSGEAQRLLEAAKQGRRHTVSDGVWGPASGEC